MVNDNKSFSIFSGSVHDADFGLYSHVPDIYIENVTTQMYNGDAHATKTMSLFNIRVDASMNNETATGAKNNLTPANKITIKQPEGFELTINPYNYPFKLYLELEYLGKDD